MVYFLHVKFFGIENLVHPLSSTTAGRKGGFGFSIAASMKMMTVMTSATSFA
jgi:hypothetical protein